MNTLYTNTHTHTYCCKGTADFYFVNARIRGIDYESDHNKNS